VYGIRREASGTFMIRDWPLSVDEKGDVTMLVMTYEGTEGLWEILTKTNIDRSLVTTNDMSSYKHILESKNGHLSDNDPSGHIKIFRSPKYRDVISKLFPAESRRRSQQRQRWTTSENEQIVLLPLILIAAKAPECLPEAWLFNGKYQRLTSATGCVHYAQTSTEEFSQKSLNRQ
jgi:hypothetical protein